jgi:PAS domain-containing protein
MNNGDRNTSAANILAFPPSASGARLIPLAPKDQTLLDTVLNNMCQGVLMFDTDAQMVFCNQRYIEMYGLSPELAVAGCGLRELLDHQKAVGAFCGDQEGYIVALLNDVAQGKTSQAIAKAADGRVFSIVHKPIAGPLAQPQCRARRPTIPWRSCTYDQPA